MMGSFKAHFPVLTNSGVHYFDYAATTPMLDVVMSEWVRYQSEVGVSLGKGEGRLSRKAMEVFESSEDTLRSFFRICGGDSIVYGKNVTELVNVLSRSVENRIQPMEAILVGPYEHHSNVLPWKYLAKRRGALFFELPVDGTGAVDYEYIGNIPAKIRILSFSSVANSNGFKFDVARALRYLPEDVLVFEDASQAVAHESVKREDRVSCVFLSSHKMYGPKNIAGAVVGPALLDQMEPVFLGGGMVDYHGFVDKWKPGDKAFMAGTHDVGLIAAWARACRFMSEVSYERIANWERGVRDAILAEMDGMGCYRLISSVQSSSLISFVHRRIHAHDVASFLGDRDIVVRSGNLCATGAIRKLGIHALTRISLGIGIDSSDVDALLDSLRELGRM